MLTTARNLDSVGENTVDVVLASGTLVGVLDVAARLVGLDGVAHDGDHGFGLIDELEGAYSVGLVVLAVLDSVGTRVCAELLHVEGAVPGDGARSLVANDAGAGAGLDLEERRGLGESRFAGILDTGTVLGDRLALVGSRVLEDDVLGTVKLESGLERVTDVDHAGLGGGLVAGVVLGVVSELVGTNLVFGNTAGLGDLDGLAEGDGVEEVRGRGTLVDVLVRGLGVAGALEVDRSGAVDANPRLAGVLDEDGLACVGAVVLGATAVDAGFVGDGVGDEELAHLVRGDALGSASPVSVSDEALVASDLGDRVFQGLVQVAVDVVEGNGAGAQLPGRGGLDRLGDAVAHVDGGRGLVVKNEGKNNLLSAVAGLVLGVVLEKVSRALAKVNIGDRLVEGLALLVNKEDAGDNTDGGTISMVIGARDRVRAGLKATGVGSGATSLAAKFSSALFGPVLGEPTVLEGPR